MLIAIITMNCNKCRLWFLHIHMGRIFYLRGSRPSCGSKNFHFGGHSSGSLGRKFPRAKYSKGEAVCRHRLEIFTAETINIWKFHSSPPDSWPVCFTVGGGAQSALSPSLAQPCPGHLLSVRPSCTEIKIHDKSLNLHIKVRSLHVVDSDIYRKLKWPR